MDRNGFPKGDFFITNVKTGLRLTAVPGGTSVLATANNKAGDEIVYSRTANPDPVLTAPLPSGKNGLQGWYFDDTVEHYRGVARNILVNRMKFDDRGRFALDGGDWAQMSGAGRDEIAQWKFEDGLISAKWSYAPHYLTATPTGEKGGFGVEYLEAALLPGYTELAKWEITPFS
ncbi:hypothetical protein [Streptomyces sp. st170]|uniref:hypothetical protein n=1 Tax=Streptomyces sp. st170 TaxID=1828058 RepID=UPI000BF02696|nr:hypothetical protein [Streptomyces sp. st170]